MDDNDGLMEARLNGHAASDSANLSRISDVVKKPWHKNATGWFAFVAMVASIISILISAYETFCE